MSQDDAGNECGVKVKYIILRKLEFQERKFPANAVVMVCQPSHTRET